MTDPTWILAPLVTLVLLVVTVQLARMVRAWRDDLGRSAANIRRDRIALEDEKHRLLVTVQDLDAEFAMGKLSEADYQSMKDRFESEAVAIIEQLEAL